MNDEPLISAVPQSPNAAVGKDVGNGAVCVCGSQRLIDRGDCRPYQTGYGPENEQQLTRELPAGRLYQCRSCHLVFRHPALPPAAANDLYAAMPTNRWDYQNATPQSWSLILQEMQDLPGSEVLDVGSFDGQFLSRLPDRWQRHAIEPSSDAVQVLQSRGIIIAGRSIEEPIDELSGRFDVITLIDVFEHLVDPIAGLNICVSYLKPGGTLFVSTGNAAHFSWRWLQGQHPYLITPQHIRFASPAFMEHWCHQQRMQITASWRHAHRQHNTAHRFAELIEVIYYSGRRPGKCAGALTRLAHCTSYGKRRLHRTGMGSIDALNDHLLVAIRRPQQSKVQTP